MVDTAPGLCFRTHTRSTSSVQIMLPPTTKHNNAARSRAPCTVFPLSPNPNRFPQHHKAS